MTRAFLADPHHVAKLRPGREAEIRPCVGAGYCVDRVLMGKDALCLHNVATGRELVLPHAIVARIRGHPSGRRCRRRARRPRGGAGFGDARPSRGAVRGVGRSSAARSCLPPGRLGGASFSALRGGSAARWTGSASSQAQYTGRCRARSLARGPDIVDHRDGRSADTGYFAGRDMPPTVWDVLVGRCRRVARPRVRRAPWSSIRAAVMRRCPVPRCWQPRVPRSSWSPPTGALGLELSDTNLGAHMSRDLQGWHQGYAGHQAGRASAIGKCLSRKARQQLFGCRE